MGLAGAAVEGAAATVAETGGEKPGRLRTRADEAPMPPMASAAMNTGLASNAVVAAADHSFGASSVHPRVAARESSGCER